MGFHPWKHKDDPRGQYTDRKRVMKEDKRDRKETEGEAK